MKLICIDKNVSSEIDNRTKFQELLFYIKPETAIITKKQPFFLPDFSNEIVAQVELVLHINKVGKNIQPKFAKAYYDGIAVSIRFTAIDLFQESIKNSKPWTKAIAFDGSSLISEFIPIELINKDTVSYSLVKNNVESQKYFHV